MQLKVLHEYCTIIFPFNGDLYYALVYSKFLSAFI